jgi:hypothetical protein
VGQPCGFQVTEGAEGPAEASWAPGLDLVAAVRRQLPFMEKMLALRPTFERGAADSRSVRGAAPGPLDRLTPLASRFHSSPTRFLLHLHGI